MKVIEYRDAPARELTSATMRGVTGRVVVSVENLACRAMGTF
jgi:hypothetical protein